MDSISPQCTPLKREYEKCFTKWYQEKFLKGDITPECQELFIQYKECVEDALKQRKLNKMLEEARKEHPFDGKHGQEGGGEGDATTGTPS